MLHGVVGARTQVDSDLTELPLAASLQGSKVRGTMILSRTTLLAAGAAGLAARQMSISRRMVMSAADLATTTLRPVKNGAINGNSTEASSLWRDNGALVFVVRRPG